MENLNNINKTSENVGKELPISDVIDSITLNKMEIWLINTLNWNINDILIAREQKKEFVKEWSRRENVGKELPISDVIDSNSEYRTIRDMRFELRMSGIDNIKDYSDIEVVELFNNKFGRDKTYIGIDRDPWFDAR